MVHAKPGPRSPESGHHFVRNQEHVVPCAPVRNEWPVVIWRHSAREGGTGNWLSNKRGNATGAHAAQQRVQFCNRLSTRSDRARPIEPRAIRIRSRNVFESPEPRLVWRAKSAST